MTTKSNEDTLSTLRRVPRPQGLKPERVQEWLQARPQWGLTRPGKSLRLLKAFPSSEVATHYSAYVTAFAESLSLPVAVSVSGGQVKVILHARCRASHLAPLTEGVLDFADQIG
ncbi:MAG TPA: hypothetical protein VGH73_15640 [Thermoanaerobaculia bacterium]|jgi:hypothetical protein